MGRLVDAAVSRAPWSLRLSQATGVVAVLACVAWLPFIGRAASSDEGGYLEVAAQWSRGGSSLYGNYWVDRPPLLIAIHAIAAALGGVVPLRLLGVAGVVVSVLLAARLVRLVIVAPAQEQATAWMLAPVVVAGAFLSTPLFGTAEVDGELLSVPFVLAGLVAVVRAFRASERRSAQWWAAAGGAAAVAAVMVKQNTVDVFVATAVLVVCGHATGRRRATGRVACWFALGAATTATVVVAVAAAWGTSPLSLWDAVVNFRFEAATVIARSATSATSHRLLGLAVAAAASMAPLVAITMAARLRRPAAAVEGTDAPAPDLRWAALALLAWEVVVVVGGGSYWLHYLLVLVPGLVVLSVAAAQRPPVRSRWVVGALALSVTSAAGAVVVTAVQPRDSTDTTVASYLREHARPGDGAVVAFGHPDILWDAGLQSPYPELWNLPVKVRDPRLTTFDAVLESRTAPAWVVVDGTSLATWGVDATEADRTLATDYHVVTEIGSYYVWHRD